MNEWMNEVQKRGENGCLTCELAVWSLPWCTPGIQHWADRQHFTALIAHWAVCQESNGTRSPSCLKLLGRSKVKSGRKRKKSPVRLIANCRTTDSCFLLEGRKNKTKHRNERINREKKKVKSSLYCVQWVQKPSVHQSRATLIAAIRPIVAKRKLWTETKWKCKKCCVSKSSSTPAFRSATGQTGLFFGAAVSNRKWGEIRIAQHYY